MEMLLFIELLQISIMEVMLDGNGDYLQTAYDADFNFDVVFTVEAYVRSTQSNSYAPIVGGLLHKALPFGI